MSAIDECIAAAATHWAPYGQIVTEKAREELAKLRAGTTHSPEPAAKTELTAEQMAWAWLSLLDEHAARGKRIAELESALTLATEAVAAEARAKVEGLTCTREERAALVVAEDLDTADIDSIRNVHRDFGDSLLELMRCRLVARREATKAKGDGNG